MNQSTHHSPKRILITPGEPAGIGPDITIQIAQQAHAAEICVIADPDMLRERATQIGLPLHLQTCDPEREPEPTPAQTLKIIEVSCKRHVQPGILDVHNAEYVLKTLDLAAKLCLAQKAHAIVTGPVHKGIISDAGFAFTGHTEFFAHAAQVKHTVMFFVVGEKMKVALVTTHLPLAKVPSAITTDLLSNTLAILVPALQHQFKILQPKIAICGLNPHAGEGGHIGDEEIEVIAPFVRAQQDAGINVIGPLAADTIFTDKYLAEVDAILAMYHDQALPVVKYAGFGDAVNVTLGLPFIRTSVDHGVALDVAGRGKANAGSLREAIALAMRMNKR